MSLYKTFVKNWLRDFPWYTILFHTHLWSLVINILKWFWGFWLLLLFLNFWAMGCHRFHQLFNVFTGILQNDDASNGQLLNRARNEEAQAPLIFPECSRILSAYLLNGTSRLLEWFGNKELGWNYTFLDDSQETWAFVPVWCYTSDLTKLFKRKKGLIKSSWSIPSG